MKALVIHHDDHDGRMSGYIMTKYYEDMGYPVTTWEVNYNTDIVFKDLEADDKVCIVDFSIPDNKMEELQKFVDVSNITWIDHHKSSIDTYKAQKHLDGIRFVGMAGCELAYIYTQGYRIKHDDKCLNIKLTNGELEFIDIHDIEIPRGIKLIGDWDVWRQTPGSREFIFAIRAYWDTCTLLTEEGRKFWEQIAKDEDDLIDKLLSEGAIVLRYVNSDNTTNCQKAAFPVKIRKFESFKCIAINTVDRSSMIFDSIKDQYEIGLVFNYEEDGIKRRMNCSIYRLEMNPDKDIDVSFIAKSFGGGGHHDAAGFTTSGTVPFS